MMTLAEFSATRREVSDLRSEIDGGEDLWESATPGYVYDYAGAWFYIEKSPDGRAYLIICNRDWIGDLSELEAHLYEYAHSEMTA